MIAAILYFTVVLIAADIKNENVGFFAGPSNGFIASPGGASFETIAELNAIVSPESIASTSDIVSFSTVAGLNALFTGETVASTTSSNVNFINDAGYLVTVDISTDTNLEAGRSLTLSGDSMEADAELYTGTFTFVVATSSMATSSSVLITKLPVSNTVTQVSGYCTSGGITIQLDERGATTPLSSGTDILTNTLSIGAYATTSSFDNPGIADSAYINLDVDGVTGTPTRCYVDVKYTKND